MPLVGYWLLDVLSSCYGILVAVSEHNARARELLASCEVKEWRSVLRSSALAKLVRKYVETTVGRRTHAVVG